MFTRKWPVGDAHFWFLGRDTNYDRAPLDVSFGLIDEGSKLNLNSVPSNMLVWLPNMSLDLTAAILDWRDTNGGNGEFQSYYGMTQPPYMNKSGPFETIDELSLLYGADEELLVGEDKNRNGVLDPNETRYGPRRRGRTGSPGICDGLQPGTQHLQQRHSPSEHPQPGQQPQPTGQPASRSTGNRPRRERHSRIAPAGQPPEEGATNLLL